MTLDEFQPSHGGPLVVRLLDDNGRVVIAASVRFLELLRRAPLERIDPTLRRLFELWVAHSDADLVVDDLKALEATA
jgi:hypothetical protein